MAAPDTQPAQGEPGNVSQDPEATQGVRKGGLTPEVAKALEGVDSSTRQIIEGDIRQRNKFLTSEQQRLSQDVQLAGILRNFMKDPQFQRYVDAKQTGDEAKFFSSELEASGVNVRGVVDGNPNEVGTSPDQEQGEGNAVAPDRALQVRIDDLEARDKARESQRLQEYNESEAAKFMERHPDWESYLPAMTKVNDRLTSQGASVGHEDLYNIARAEAQVSLAGLTESEEGQQQAPASQDVASSENLQTQADGGDVDAAPSRGRRIASLTDAFQAAKKTVTGSTDEITIRYS